MATLTRLGEFAGAVKYRVESTPEVQEAYNKIRKDTERRDAERALSQHLQPPSATHMSRSTTVESSTSTSTSRSPVHSPTNSIDNSNHGPASQATPEPRRSRGRRKGPLSVQTRTDTAFKRKYKLICDHHRAKKITCGCYDITELEKRYPDPHALESSEGSGNRRRSGNQTSAPALTPSDGTSYNDLGFVGLGAALTPSPRNDEPNELENPLGPTPAMRRSVQNIITFDIDSAASVTALTQAPQGRPYFPGEATNLQINSAQEQGGLFLIGSEMLGYPRWRCEFNPPTDTESEHSSETCSWTGPLRDLESHFRSSHHSFDDADFPHWSKCTNCTTMKSNWDTQEACTARNCINTSWQKFFYGSTSANSGLESLPTYTQSGASESGLSWTRDPPWSYPNSGGTEPSSGWYKSYSGGSYYGRSTNSEGKSEACDSASASSSPGGGGGGGRAYDTIARRPPSTPYSSLLLLLLLLPRLKNHAARRRGPGPDPKRRAGLAGGKPYWAAAAAANQMPSGCRSVAGLLRYAKSPWRQLVPVVVPLMATIIHDGGGGGGDCLPVATGEAATMRCVVRWWSLVMLVLGFLTTWVFKDNTAVAAASSSGSSGGGGDSGVRRWGRTGIDDDNDIEVGANLSFW